MQKSLQSKPFVENQKGGNYVCVLGNMMVFSILFCTLLVIVLQIKEKLSMLEKIIMLAKMLSPKLHLFTSAPFTIIFPLTFLQTFLRCSLILKSLQSFPGKSMTAYRMPGQSELEEYQNCPLPLQQQNCWFKHHLTLHGQNLTYDGPSPLISLTTPQREHY